MDMSTMPLPLTLSLRIATRIGIKACRIKTLIMLSNACVLALRNMTPWIRVPVTCCRHGIMLNRLLGSSSFALALLLMEVVLKLVLRNWRRDVFCHCCKVVCLHQRGVSGACACASTHGASRLGRGCPVGIFGMLALLGQGKFRVANVELCDRTHLARHPGREDFTTLLLAQSRAREVATGNERNDVENDLMFA